MEFRVIVRVLRLRNYSVERSAHLINTKCITAAVIQPGNVSVRNSYSTIYVKSYCTSSAILFKSTLCSHSKIIMRRNLFMKFLKQLMTVEITKEEKEEEWGGPEAFKLIKFIKDDFDEVVTENLDVMVFFSASWCPHCRRLRKAYGMAAIKSNEAKLSMVFATFDVTQNPDLADEKGVVGIPLIKYYRNGKFITNYRGKRTSQDLFDFAKNPPHLIQEPKQTDI